jgi:hypothetical protein
VATYLNLYEIFSGDYPTHLSQMSRNRDPLTTKGLLAGSLSLFGRGIAKEKQNP